MELEVKYYFRCKNVGADGSYSEGFIVCAYVRISIFPLALEMVTSFVTRILIMLCFMLESRFVSLEIRQERIFLHYLVS